jgi:hypothetical protein
MVEIVLPISTDQTTYHLLAIDGLGIRLEESGSGCEPGWRATPEHQGRNGVFGVKLLANCPTQPLPASDHLSEENMPT